MAPEQAEGREADQRADIWAFGTCLFEALAGRRAFEAESMPLTLARVLDREPAWEALPGDLNWRVRELLRRCLVKKPELRIHHVADARIALLEALDDPALEPTGAFSPEREEKAHSGAASRLWWVGWAAAALAALATWSLKSAERSSASEGVVRLQVSTGEEAAPSLFEGSSSLAISPDGRSVVYSTDSGLFIRRIDELQPRPLEGAEGGRGPFFSPDGERVGYYVFGKRELRQVSVRGGPSVRISESGSFTPGATWGDDDTVYFTTAGTAGVHSVPASGGEAEPLDLSVPSSIVDLRWPAVVPGGRALLVTLLTQLSAADARIGVIDLSKGEVLELPLVGHHPAYVESGHIVFGFEGSLFAVGFDSERLELRGDPVPVIEGVATDQDSGASNFAVSERGTLAYLAGSGPARSSERTLHWVDRDGVEQPVPLAGGGWTGPRISRRDGRIALAAFTGSSDVWLWERSRDSATRVTFDPAIDHYAMWSADERELFFSSNRVDRRRGIFRLAVDGSGSPQPVVGSPESSRPQDVSSDGRYLVYQVGPYDNSDLGVLNLTGDPDPRPLVASSHHETGADCRPTAAFCCINRTSRGPSRSTRGPSPTSTPVDGRSRSAVVRSPSGRHPETRSSIGRPRLEVTR